MQHRAKLIAVGVVFLLDFAFLCGHASNRNASILVPVDVLVEQGCVIEFSYLRTRVDIPDSLLCSDVREAILALPRLSDIRLGYGGRGDEAVFDSYEWNQEAAAEAVNDYRRAFPNADRATFIL